MRKSRHSIIKLSKKKLNTAYLDKKLKFWLDHHKMLVSLNF